MNRLRQVQDKKQEEGCVNPGASPDSLHHLELRLIKLETETLQDCEHQLLVEPVYDDEPVYDEEPGEVQECWFEQDFILAALGGDNSTLPGPLKSELCTCERMEEDLRNKSNEVLGDGDKPRLVDYKGVEKQSAVAEEPSIILTKLKEIIEDVPCKDSSATPKFSGLEKKSSHLDKQNMIIFDPGGEVQNKKSKDVNNKFEDVIRFRSEVKLEANGIQSSVGGQLRDWQDIGLNSLVVGQLLKQPSQLQRKVFIIELGKSAGLQEQNIQEITNQLVSEINQQCVDSVRTEKIVLPYKYKFQYLDPPMNPEYHEPSKKTVTIYIFDPGGNLGCVQGVLLGVSAKFFKVHHTLKDVLDEEELCTKEKGNILVDAFSNMQEDAAEPNQE